MASMLVRACFFLVTCCLMAVANVDLASTSLRSCYSSSQATRSTSCNSATFLAVPLRFSLVASSSPWSTGRLDYAWLTRSMQAYLSFPKLSGCRVVEAVCLSTRYVDTLLT